MALSADQLREVLDYAPETGIFTWRKKTCRKVVAGAQAGALNHAGYIVIGIAGEIHYAHRLAWVWMLDQCPDQIDHKDGERTNNAWANLRRASSQQNILNSKRAESNTSGFKGVSWHRAAEKWAAHIHVMGKKKHLGLFGSAPLAHAAYMAAANSIDSNFARAE